MPVWFAIAFMAIWVLCAAWYLVNIIYARTGSLIADPSTGRIYQVDVGGKYKHITVFVDWWHAVAYWTVTVPMYLMVAGALIGGMAVAFMVIRRRRGS